MIKLFPSSTLKSLEINPKESKALCTLGLIKMALGETEEARNNLLRSVYYNNQEEEAYHALSMMLETTDDAEKLIENIEQVNTECLAPHRNLFIDFALSNCFHKIKKFDISAEYLKRANDKKLLGSPSNAKKIEQAITLSLSHSVQAEQLIIEKDRGKERIFIVGMPRSGSTLLETMLSMNPRIKDLGESNSLTKAIAKPKTRMAYIFHKNYTKPTQK